MFIRDQEVHNCLYPNHQLNILYSYPYSEWAGFKLEVGVADRPFLLIWVDQKLLQVLFVRKVFTEQLQKLWTLWSPCTFHQWLSTWFVNILTEGVRQQSPNSKGKLAVINAVTCWPQTTFNMAINPKCTLVNVTSSVKGWWNQSIKTDTEKISTVENDHLLQAYINMLLLSACTWYTITAVKIYNWMNGFLLSYFLKRWCRFLLFMCICSFLLLKRMNMLKVISSSAFHSLHTVPNFWKLFFCFPRLSCFVL